MPAGDARSSLRLLSLLHGALASPSPPIPFVTLSILRDLGAPFVAQKRPRCGSVWCASWRGSVASCGPRVASMWTSPRPWSTGDPRVPCLDLPSRSTGTEGPAGKLSQTAFFFLLPSLLLAVYPTQKQDEMKGTLPLSPLRSHPAHTSARICS